MSTSFSTCLDTAVNAARAAGTLAVSRIGDPGYLKWKGNRDVVTEASLLVQEAVVSAIRAEHPGDGIFTEEGPDDQPMPVDAERLWIIDPICGSLNFVQGIPHFAISIALRAEGRIQVGVVYDPCRQELFAAAADRPAALNGRSIVVQQISEGADAWNGAIVGTDWPYDGERRRRARSIVPVMADQVADCSLMGSPALGLCYVAAGRLHAYWHLDLKIWDVAAASVILERAGAVLTDAQGMTWLHSDGGYVATNNVVHNSLLNCIRPLLGQ